MNREGKNKEMKAYVLENLRNFDLDKPIVVGESKKIFKGKESNIILIEMIPSLYSFTHNRYGYVPGTDKIRMEVWDVLDRNISDVINHYLQGNKIDLPEVQEELETAEEAGLFVKGEFWHSGYFGNIEVDGKMYAVATCEGATPLEFVYKTRLNGTMKHNLDIVTEFDTLQGAPIQYEGALPHGIVRFDWRNPLWKDVDGEKIRRKDECIPDDFAGFYTDVKKSKVLVRLYSKIVNAVYKSKGYELVDVCYFINRRGDKVYSEVSLDNMRVTKKEESFDKDLWRQGKDNSTILRIWNEVLSEIRDVNLVAGKVEKKPVLLLPSGRMKETAIALVDTALGIKLSEAELGMLAEKDKQAYFEFESCVIHFLKPKYMMDYVKKVDIDYAMFTNAMYDDFDNMRVLHKHEFDGIKVVVLAHKNHEGLKKIVTNHIGYAKRHYPDMEVEFFAGNLEAFPTLDKSTAILDVMDTGESAKQNNLMESKFIEPLYLFVAKHERKQ